MRTETTAYCWASGQIEFGTSTPAGAIAIASGKDHVVRKEIAGTARLAYDNETLLVPGIPEADGEQRKASDALAAYLRWLKKRERKGFRVNTRID